MLSLNESNFSSEVIDSTVPVMVDFFGEWCAPCRALSPVLESLSQKNGDKVKIVKINVDENPDLAAKYQIGSIPAVLVFKSGSLVKSIIGLQSEQALQKVVDEVAS